MTNCDIRIWHTLAEVELFVFLFVIKSFLNCCCSIEVLYCFAHFFLFCDLFFVYKTFYLLSCGVWIIDILRRQCHVEIYA